MSTHVRQNTSLTGLLFGPRRVTWCCRWACWASRASRACASAFHLRGGWGRCRWTSSYWYRCIIYLGEEMCISKENNSKPRNRRRKLVHKLEGWCEPEAEGRWLLLGCAVDVDASSAAGVWVCNVCAPILCCRRLFSITNFDENIFLNAHFGFFVLL